MNEKLIDLLPVIIPLAAMLGLWILLRHKATKLESASEIDKRIGNGKPVVLKFFRNT